MSSEPSPKPGTGGASHSARSPPTRASAANGANGANGADGADGARGGRGMVPHGNARRLAVRAPARHNQGALEPTSPFPEDRMAVLVGKKAPEFTLQGSQGEDVSLGDFKGKSVVLYFYPKDDTPGCTREACDFRDARRKFTAAGAVVLGVSPDSLKSHDRFIDKFELPFLLLSDPDHAVAEAYGTWVEKS